jgi:hypothetical protein
MLIAKNLINETSRGKPRGISTKDISHTNAASSGVFTLRENKTGAMVESFLLDTVSHISRQIHLF